MFNQDGATGSAPPKHESSRLRSLDGLRGVAIIVVIVWHCYGEFSNLLPFGDRFSFYPVRTGWAAVQLFFLISGFVILMTLEKCQTFSEFAWRRWLRLFPAMFVGSIIILAFDWTFATGPYADRTVINLLPGWLFVSPQLLHAVTGLNIDSMDGPFWSLYVEVCFYVVFGVSYFKLGRRGAISVLLVLFALSAIASTLLKLGFGGEPLNSVSGVFSWWLGPIHFGWFASGALFYIAFRNQDYRIFRAAIIVAIVSALYDSEDWRRAVFALLTVVAVFSCALATSWGRALFEWRGFTFMGFVSYPLYLIHNNISVGGGMLMAKILPAHLAAATPIAPLVPILIAVAIAWVIARYVEPAMRDGLRAAFAFVRRRPAAEAV